MTLSPFLTPREDLHLFSPALISSLVRSKLPEGYSIRPLRKDDFAKGFMDVLAQLSTTGNPTLDMFEERFDVMKRTGNYFLVCIEAEDRIVACATLILEHKFLHDCGQAGHIEDVVVDGSQRGKKLGIRLIEQLQYMAEQLQCYKIILNCTEKNVPFYEKCELTRAQVQMTHYFHHSDSH
ncbi:acyl-CoA N-acyltransferase [Syncephalastrum racemosum]|uniref:Glucosamine 6-phosphate N-acetyltransferase n=1 Tax=Syncephalastrum racemosum TaxID=13706 RepID=A0A1X2HQ57_SYNRA|nr:acyl-CoA N-acyltransferase [Syncephalastrum racemosum]